MGVINSAPYVVADVILKSVAKARSEFETPEDQEDTRNFWQRLMGRTKTEETE